MAGDAPESKVRLRTSSRTDSSSSLWQSVTEPAAKTPQEPAHRPGRRRRRKGEKGVHISKATAVPAIIQGDAFSVGGVPAELPVLPHAEGQLAANGDFMALEIRAKDAATKLQKWERAFQRENGAVAMPEQKAASNTYTGYLRRYVYCLARMEQLAAAREQQHSAAEDELGVLDAAAEMNRLSLKAGSPKAKRRNVITSEAFVPTRKSGSMGAAAAGGGRTVSENDMSAETRGIIESACQNNVLFNSLSKEELHAMLGSLRASKAPPILKPTQSERTFLVLLTWDRSSLAEVTSC